MPEKIQLGSKVRDTISGFEGIAIAVCEYLHGFGVRDVLVAPKGLHEGTPISSQWIREEALEVLELPA